MVDRTCSSSAHLFTQISENSLRSSSSSISLERLAGSVEAMNRVVLLDGGCQAHDVEGHPAQERGVVTQARGGDPQLAQLVADKLVNVVGFGLLRILKPQILGQHDELRADRVGLEPGHDKGFSALTRGDQAIGADGGGDVVIGQKHGQAGDVAVGAIGVAGTQGHLLGGTLAVEHAVLGIEVDAHHGGQLGHVVVGRAGLDPVVQRLIELARRLEPLAAGVLNRTDGFFEQGAVGGDGQVDAAAHHLTSQTVMIALGIEAEERDPEAVLASRRTVARARVASGPHEHRHHIEPEADGRLRPGLGDLDRCSQTIDRRTRL